MFDSFANSHNGYGSFEDLEAAQVEDAADFWHRYYAPGNAVLVVVGDFETGEARDLVERHFGDIRRRRVPRHPSFAEPIPAEPRRGRHHDPNAPTPALTLGYRIPDPVADPAGIAALTVLSALLTDGEASVLRRRLVRDDGLVTDVSSWLGVFPGTTGPPERDPSRLQIMAFYPAPAARDGIVAAIDEEIARIAAGPDPDRVSGVVARLTGSYLRTVDGFLTRALAIAPLEMFRGTAETVNEYPSMLAAVGADEVAAAAGRWLDPQARAELDLVAGGAE
jgi:predicted Zn-dependent peptidase